MNPHLISQAGCFLADMFRALFGVDVPADFTGTLTTSWFRGGLTAVEVKSTMKPPSNGKVVIKPAHVG